MASFEKLTKASQKEQIRRWEKREAQLSDPKRTREQADKEYERDNKRNAKKWQETQANPKRMKNFEKKAEYIEGVGWTEKRDD